MSQGIRNNQGKPQWSQVNWKALEPMVRVLEEGGKLVGKNNWKKGLPVLEVCESLLRHTFALMDGEDNDQKSGQPHIGHILANAMFLSYMMQFRPDMDDREKQVADQHRISGAELDGYKHDHLLEMLKLHGVTYEEWCSKTEGMSEEEKGKVLMSSIPQFWKVEKKEESKAVVLTESNKRRAEQYLTNLWGSKKEERPRIVRPMPEYPPDYSCVYEAVQNAKKGKVYPRERDYLEGHYQKTVFNRDPVTEM